MGLSALLTGGAPLAPDVWADVRRRTILEGCKWDPQVEDVSVLAPFPLLVARPAWEELAALAEALARETAAAEDEILARPELHGELGLPRGLRRALGRAAREGGARGTARVMRFDFHPTDHSNNGGWLLSEVNSDVPGGFVEAAGFTRLVAEQVPGAVPAGDPAARLADAVAAAAPPGGAVALVHATAYADDRQVMVYLARELAARGLEPILAAPDHLRWPGGHAEIHAFGVRRRLAAAVRFFPGEWLPALPRACGWRAFAHGGRTPVSNPAAALLVQSKRFPLLWGRLATPLPTWRRLLPETRDPRDADLGDGRWVVKPTLGRVGDLVGVPGVTPERQWRRLVRAARRRPRYWVAQRRFAAAPLATADGAVFPCLGVFTVDGRAAGIYGRAARRPLVDHLARDVAVLVVP